MNLNVFRVLADLCHISSKCILIFAIHRNRSSEGVSLLTQVLYAIVFITRYLDLMLPSQWRADRAYLVFFKLFYILSSLYIIYLMVKVYARTREKETSWRLAAWSVLGAAIGAPIVLAIDAAARRNPCWAFSIILESVCVLPQLVLLRQTRVPTVINSYYLLTLGSYRALYIFNWLYRGFGPEKFWDPISDVFGVIQTLLYIDFAWVYYSRQRVKLRHGGIVDEDDLQNGWFIGKILTSRAVVPQDEEADPLNPQSIRGRTHGWGRRGISVSADDTL